MLDHTRIDPDCSAPYVPTNGWGSSTPTVFKKVPKEPMVAFDVSFWVRTGFSATDFEEIDLGTSQKTCRDVADFLELSIPDRIVGIRKGTKDGKHPQRRWVVSAAEDLIDDDAPRSCCAGVRLTSPLLPYPFAYECAPTIGEQVNEIGEAVHGCDFNIRVSVPGIETLDPLSLIMMVPDSVVLADFDRNFEHLRRPWWRLLLAAARNPDVDLRHPYFTNATSRINLDPWRVGDGYIDFRHAGGAWHRKPKALTKWTERFVEYTTQAILVSRLERDAFEKKVRLDADLVRRMAETMKLANSLNEMKKAVLDFDTGTSGKPALDVRRREALSDFVETHLWVETPWNDDNNWRLDLNVFREIGTYILAISALSYGGHLHQRY
jgi:hypothetical protein